MCTGAELFGLFNYPGRREGQLKYYTVKVPLRVQPQGEGICTMEANWLDHMTQHFNNGASLVDGYFQLASDKGELVLILLNLKQSGIYIITLVYYKNTLVVPWFSDAISIWSHH